MSKKFILVDSKARSLAKTLVFRVLIVTADGIIILLFTHKIDLALEIVIVRNIVAAILYYFHERSWNYISWGQLEKRK
jgi:uncharacterized membrane protein